MDPVAAVERNQHLVLAARMTRYKSRTFERLLNDRRVFEYWANAMCTIPMRDYPLFESIRRRRERGLRPHLEQLGSVADHVLKRLQVEGPLPSKAFNSDERVHGYWENAETQPKTKATSHALNLLNDMGLIQVVRREGTIRYFDVREKAVPRDLLDQATQIREAESSEALVDKYIRAYRVFDAGDSRFGWQHLSADERRSAVDRRVQEGSVIPLRVEGVKRNYFMLAEDVDELMSYMNDESHGSSSQVHFLPPLDNLLWRRERIEDFFDFSYTWEVYIPASKRKFGYYAMPILVGDTFIGRIDPRLDRERAELNLELLQINPHIRWTKSLRQRIFRALHDFAAFHQAKLGVIRRTDPEGLVLE